MNLGIRVCRSLFLALCFVAPLYCVWIFEAFFYRDPSLWINTILGVVSVWIFLSIKRDIIYLFGFWVGVLWFYWIGFSFSYFGFSYLIPIIAIIVACIYMVIFVIALWSENLWYRGLCLLGLSFIHPFGFDWLVVDSFFAYSYFGIQKYEFALIILGVILCKISSKEKMWIWVGSASLIGALNFGFLDSTKEEKLPFKVELLESHYSQDFKWQRENAKKMTEEMIVKIEKTISKGQELIILPETAFPFVLEKSFYFSKFKELSKKATLVIGSLRSGEKGLYNSIYVFQNGEVQIIDKVVLAPFGEKIPLPQWISRYLEDIFFGKDGAKFVSGESFKSFTFQDQEIRAVVCYEGTSSEAYKEAPKYMIVISNNAWFEGSIEASLQKNLMKYYARKNHTTLMHSSNGSRSFVIFP